MSLVERIRIAAKEKGLTLAEIERTLGFGNSSIRKWDQNSPSLEKIVATANFLGKSLPWIATGEESPSSFDANFINRYEKLSDIDKKKIEHFMDISLINITEEPPSPTYSDVTLPPISMVKESSAYMISKDTLAILGYVAAGKPIEGISVPLGYVSSPDSVNADYVLIAKGHSMEPVILDNEYIYVKNCSDLHVGDIGIFYIDGDVTCKEYQPHPKCLILRSLNPDFQPFKYSLNESHDFKIQGKVMLTLEQSARLHR